MSSVKLVSCLSHIGRMGCFSYLFFLDRVTYFEKQGPKALLGCLAGILLDLGRNVALPVAQGIRCGVVFHPSLVTISYHQFHLWHPQLLLLGKPRLSASRRLSLRRSGSTLSVHI